MRYAKSLIFLALSVVLVVVLAKTDTLAGGWKPIADDHEQRISDLEADIDGLTTRMGDAETTDDVQDGRLDSLEENQSDFYIYCTIHVTL